MSEELERVFFACEQFDLSAELRAVRLIHSTYCRYVCMHVFFLPSVQGLGNDDETEDLTVFVQGLLQQMQTRFQQMSDTIIGRIDEMGTRIDDLEKSIADLMEQAGVEDNGKK